MDSSTLDEVKVLVQNKGPLLLELSPLDGSTRTSASRPAAIFISFSRKKDVAVAFRLVRERLSTLATCTWL